uniref:B-cell receptor CD22 n=1 Tax=Salarias fasciatus TaxID=181472 RepID=A0A672FN30_SALFA
MFLDPSVGTDSAAPSVTFENPNYCASTGSTVEFRCSYSYPAGHIITKTEWSKGGLERGRWSRVALSLLPSYQNRTEYRGDLQHSCNLAIHRLQESDSGHYHFRFDTNTHGWPSFAAQLKSRVQPQRVRVGGKVTLHCQTDCTLSSTVWFKNGQRLTQTEFQAQAEDAGKYVCAVDGQESAQSEPVSLDVQCDVEVSPAGVLTAGRAVNLTCSSVANPAAERHAWFRVVSGAHLQVGSGRVLRLPSLEPSNTGLYFCQAWNRLGENNSTLCKHSLVEISVKYIILHFILLTGIAIKVSVVLFVPLAFIWAW